jgi:hypothetical protein
MMFPTGEVLTHNLKSASFFLTDFARLPQIAAKEHANPIQGYADVQAEPHHHSNLYRYAA